MHPQHISIEDYTYHLPDEKIAERPAENRSASRLLICRAGVISEDVFAHLPAHLPSGVLMVFNNTKVVAARLLFKKETGGIIEIFCLEPHEDYKDTQRAMHQTGSVKWLCLVGGASKWKNDAVLQMQIETGDRLLVLQARCLEKRTACFVIELTWNNAQLDFATLLHHAGKIPLPPYIKREAEAADAERYQTVYARHHGSVAAPTAGLHFTEDVLKSLEAGGVETEYVTLHVGAGTFRPVKAATMGNHVMHAEMIEVTRAFISQLIASTDKKVVAVGTTSARTIESLYWLGRKLILQPGVFDNEMPFLSQWECYEQHQFDYSTAQALQSLLDFMDKKKLPALVARTQIMIAPGYKFKLVNGLITNFHQPASTLLLLVAAFIGNAWRKTYDYALKNHFRFLSYGDASLLWQ